MEKREYGKGKEKREITRFISKNEIVINQEKVDEFFELAKIEYPMPPKPCRVTRQETVHMWKHYVKKKLREYKNR